MDTDSGTLDLLTLICVLEPHTQITVASPAGGEAPLDLSSVKTFKEGSLCQEFLKNKENL
jgi:hypothetical protein